MKHTNPQMAKYGLQFHFMSGPVALAVSGEFEDLRRKHGEVNAVAYLLSAYPAFVSLPSDNPHTKQRILMEVLENEHQDSAPSQAPVSEPDAGSVRERKGRSKGRKEA